MINFELIAQVSSVITLIFGFIAIYFTMKAARGLLPGEFKDLINLSNIFLVIVIIGVSVMAFYHFSENEIAKNIWDVSIFVSLFFSLFESYKLMQFGKVFKTKKKKK